jgi:hypothetical protein
VRYNFLSLSRSAPLIENPCSRNLSDYDLVSYVFGTGAFPDIASSGFVSFSVEGASKRALWSSLDGILLLMCLRGVSGIPYFTPTGLSTVVMTKQNAPPSIFYVYFADFSLLSSVFSRARGNTRLASRRHWWGASRGGVRDADTDDDVTRI